MHESNVPSMSFSPISSSSTSSDSEAEWRLEGFLRTASRVVKIVEMPPLETLSALGRPTVWSRVSEMWAVFDRHSEACAALANVACLLPALESELEPFHLLSKVNFHQLSTNVRVRNWPAQVSPRFQRDNRTPTLTPSGRDFAIGGRVQNISSDPLSPCIMYWPDNEPFPEPGQIRPGNLLDLAHLPILNTGNRGPIAHQPGDWVCKKCNYLNWRRRKVCQTCLPYAEGNGDSISAAVQAERIALLTSVLSQTSRRSQSLTTPRRFDRYDHLDSLYPQHLRQPHKFQSHSELDAHSRFTGLVYQTPSISDPSLLAIPRNPHEEDDDGTTLLPAFLQEIVSSPSSDSSEMSDSEASDRLRLTSPQSFGSVAAAAPPPVDLKSIWSLDNIQLSFNRQFSPTQKY
ncbi:hypothetical protein E1B28_013457 [Marasmius oreades]|uniref:RanBP2-type domain-containing protein n=1 Tax=Marasmius oreades TaxID=181124 RepID=A0A9P7UP18_9AGAR|nr:uncharacterized protein E1B28_013457 [Marasmius oreades]KAG7087496.1 hypothetical protein E1B28_013457 [Marasmius oreades]